MRLLAGARPGCPRVLRQSDPMAECTPSSADLSAQPWAKEVLELTEVSAVAGAPHAARRRGYAVPPVTFGVGPVRRQVLRPAVDIARQVGSEGEVGGFVEEIAPGPGVETLCTHSALAEIAPPAHALLERHYDVVTSCEQMIKPWLGPGGRSEPSEGALRADRTVLGAEVYSGFVEDVVPLIATVPARDSQEAK